MVLQDREQLERSIMIDDLQIPTTDFNITREQLDKLVQSGSDAAKEFISNRHLENIEKANGYKEFLKHGTAVSAFIGYTCPSLPGRKDLFEFLHQLRIDLGRPHTRIF